MSVTPLKILMANHRWWYPTTINGADIANHEFARRLVRSGMTVRVFGRVAPGVQERTRRRSYVADGVKVNLVESDFLRCLSQIIEKYRPDIVMTSSPEPSCGIEDIERMMATFHHFDLPVILYVHDLEPAMTLFENCRHHLADVLTNSHFMAQRIKTRWQRESQVIYPVPSGTIFKVSEQPGPFITFFNPLPHKGMDIVEALVQSDMKERAFLFVEGFMETDSYGMTLARTGNVVHARRSPDVASMYMMTRTLIVPSQWEEPFGRVALEAMYNRIPVIASNTGGLSESVGDGGILLDDFVDKDAWKKAIERLDDDVYRQEVIEAGSHHVKKFSMEKQIEQFKQVFHKVVG